MVFTEEYSVRAARLAVYGLMGIDRNVCPVTPYNRDPKVLLRALKKAYLSSMSKQSIYPSNYFSISCSFHIYTSMLETKTENLV